MNRPMLLTGWCIYIILLGGIGLMSDTGKGLVVTVEGEAAGIGLAAKEKSLENALRNAVEKGFGVYIDSTTLVENAALLEDSIISEINGFVRHYEILEQTQQQGVIITRIRAEVSMEKIWESDSLQVLLKRMGAPRFVVIAQEYHNGEYSRDSFALQKVTELLTSRGFHLVNAVNSRNLPVQKLKQVMQNTQWAARIAKTANAEIIVLIEAVGKFERKTVTYGNHFDIYRGNCDLRVVRADSGKIVVSALKSRLSGSIKDAIIAAAQDNVEDIVKQLLAAWSGYLNMGRSIELTVSNITVSRLVSLIDGLESMEGVSRVEQRNFSGGVAQLIINSKHKSMYLAEGIEGIPGFILEITHFSAEKIVAKNKIK